MSTALSDSSPRALPPALLGGWFAAARREGLLAALTPDAWQTLCAVLSFTTLEGARAFALDQLALALGLSPEAAQDRLLALTATLWNGSALAELGYDRDGNLTGATLAPLELLADVEPQESPSAVSTPLPPEAHDLVPRMEELGLYADQIDRLLENFPRERIRRQLEWLPRRAAHNPAAYFIRAVEGDWAEPHEGRRTSPPPAPDGTVAADGQEINASA